MSDSYSPVENVNNLLEPPSPSTNHIEEPLWYWGTLTKDETEEKLKGLPDGSFLVRDSNTDNNYTLALRHGGKCKSIRILVKDERYGLKENECIFESLEALINHYSAHSLTEFNRTLTITLLYPVIKKPALKITMSEALSILAEQARKLHKAKREYTVLMEEQTKLCQELRLLEMEAKAHTFSKEMYESITKLSDNLLNELEDLEIVNEEKKHILQDNTSLAFKRHFMAAKHIEQIEENIKKKEETNIQTIHKINAHVSTLLDAEEYCDYIREQLLEYGAKPDLIDCILSEDLSDYAWPETQWLVNCSRKEAVALLADKDLGTFLFRPKQSPDSPYVLSIKCSNEDETHEVKHCVVFHPEGRGFGFKEEAAVFESLDELVEKHSQVSLKMYFSQIDTCLAYPVFGPQALEMTKFPYELEENE